MNIFSPIRIFWQDGVAREQIEVLISAVEYFLELAGVDQKIKIVYGKSLKLDEHKGLIPNSIIFNRINARSCLKTLLEINQKIDSDYYVLTAIKDHMFYVDIAGKKIFFAIGWAKCKEGALVMVGEPFVIQNPYFRDTITTTTLHELKHIFEFPCKHCDNINCVMYAAVNLEHIDIEKPFCESCLRNLRAYFDKSDSLP